MWGLCIQGQTSTPIELLEERLLDFSGTLLLVSHDRDFLDNVVTATLALDGEGGVVEYAGGCGDWLDQMGKSREQARSASQPDPITLKQNPPKRKLLNKEREQLKTLPKKIEEMETERDFITSLMQEPDYYRNPKNDPSADQRKLEQYESRIIEAYEAWEKLEELANS